MILNKLKNIFANTSTTINYEDACIDVEEMKAYLEDEDTLRDEITKKFFLEELIRVSPDCYKKKQTVVFQKMEDERTILLNEEPLIFENKIPFEVAKELLETLNNIKKDAYSKVRVSMLRNMVYVVHNGIMYATQYRPCNGVIMTPYGFIDTLDVMNIADEDLL